jgi:two-component sensor histidine kinase
MFFQKTIETKIKNKWLRRNLKIFPWIILVSITFCVIQYVFWQIAPEKIKKEHAAPEAFDYAMTFLQFLILPLGAINSVYLFKTTSLHTIKRRKWKSITLQIVVLMLGIAASVFAMECLDLLAIKYKVTPNYAEHAEKYNFFKDYLKATWFFSIVGIIFGIPIIISQSTKEELESELKENEIKLLRLQQTQTKSQLELLQSKINPHFLYNALNSIASLAHDEPDKVEKMAISLSKLFRYSIATSSNNYATIKEEIDIATTYLDIEKIRFGDKLNYNIKIEADPTILIPRFLLQPLVENSIKHGTSKITGTGLVNVEIIHRNKELTIAVHDNGPAFPEGLISGYGLQSTHEKLNLLFPSNYELSFLNGQYKQLIIKLKNI